MAIHFLDTLNVKSARWSQAHLVPFVELSLYWSAVLVKGLPDMNCCIASRSDCRIASNCRQSCRIAGASWPCFCSQSLSSFFTQSSFVTAITYMLRAGSLNLRQFSQAIPTANLAKK